MSSETQNEAQPTPTNPPPVEAPWLTFPPFPEPPPGVTLIPFSEFKPNGLYLRMDDDQGPEIDPLGIPTVTLGVKHALTEEEQARKKKKKKTTIKAGGVVRKLLWFEEWEEGEHMRRCIVNPLISRVDRLHQACQDFKAPSTRSWPPPTSGVPQLWDAFRLYIGIIASILPPPSKRRQFHEPEDDDDDDGDNGDDDIASSGKTEVEMVKDEEEIRERRQKRVQEEIETRKKNFNEVAKARAERRGELKEERMEYFFDDPELAMKEFFSAHFRDKGLVWDKQRCRDGPILVEYFLNYIIRSNVFPEYDRELRRAVNVVKLAKAELPLTFQVGETLPDVFSVGCEHLFGDMTNALIVWDPPSTEAKKEEPKNDAKTEPAKTEDVEMKKEEELLPIPTSAFPIIDPNDPSFGLAQKVEQDAVADNVDINGIEVAPTSGWGNISELNTDVNNDINNWGDSGGGWGETIGGWDASDVNGPDAADDWLPTYQKSLTDLLGPTVFPLTHTTGVMERSTRRILKVVEAPQKGAGSKKKKTRSPAGAVEEELESRTGYVVFGPWKKVGNDTRSDITPPIVLPDSRGPTTLDDPETSPPPKPDAHIHDPEKDEITVLVEPKTAEKLKDAVGMGILASWIQIARIDTEATEEWAGFKKGGEKKGAVGVNGQTTKWWYMEQVMATFVSFHTDRYYPDQD